MKTIQNSPVARTLYMTAFLHLVIGWIIAEGNTNTYLSILADFRRVAVMLIIGAVYAALAQKHKTNK